MTRYTYMYLDNHTHSQWLAFVSLKLLIGTQVHTSTQHIVFGYT